MQKFVCLAFTICVVFAFPSLAQKRSAMTDAEAKLAGIVIGSEAACGIEIDHPSMLAWFDERVPSTEGDEFASNLDMFVQTQKFAIDGFTKSQLVLHCHSVLAKVQSAGWSPQ